MCESATLKTAGEEFSLVSIPTMLQDARAFLISSESAGVQDILVVKMGANEV